MAVTYPLTIPTSLKVKNSSFRLIRSVGVSTSNFTFAEQKFKNQGERWEGEITLIAYNYTDIGALQAFAVKLRGRLGTFLYGDPDFLARGLRGVGGGTPLVNGASQTGNSLNVKGLPLSTTGVWKAGDYIQLGSGSTSKLHMVVNDVNSDVSGLATVDIEPAIITAQADLATIVTTGAKGVFGLSSNITEWSSNSSSIFQISFAFSEAISV